MLSIDGVGAYDHVFGSSMMMKLWEIPSLRGLLPFVRSVYGRPSRYKWRDSEGVCHDIHQHEGGKQGDPLMPLLFSPAGHDALRAVKQNLLPMSSCSRSWMMCALCHVQGALEKCTTCLVLHFKNRPASGCTVGKPECGTKAGVQPPDLEELGPEVWSKEGVMILGTPVGSDRFVEVATEERISEEARLWDALGWVPEDVIISCAPCLQSAQYADRHDRGMMMAMEKVLGSVPGSEAQKEEARHLATLPMRLGGLGLRSAFRTAAYWASWADALPMLSARLPGLTNRAEDVLTVHPMGCLREAAEAASILDRSGFVGRPGWQDLRAGRRPPQPTGAEPGEWQHGWHYHGSCSLEHHFRESVSRPTSEPLRCWIDCSSP